MRDASVFFKKIIIYLTFFFFLIFRKLFPWCSSALGQVAPKYVQRVPRLRNTSARHILGKYALIDISIDGKPRFVIIPQYYSPKKVQDDDDEDEALSDHEEEFYYQEIAVNHMSSPPTMSHRDMARPPHEDPEYQKQLRLEVKQPPAVVVPTNNSTGQIAKDRFFNFRISPIRPRSPVSL